MNNNELYHYGVKGQKWGVRREQKRLDRKQKKWERNVERNWDKAYNKAADTINKRISSFNAEWKKKGIDFSNTKSKGYKKYTKAYCDMWNDIYAKELESTFGKAPIDRGRKWCETAPGFMDPATEFN